MNRANARIQRVENPTQRRKDTKFAKKTFWGLFAYWDLSEFESGEGACKLLILLYYSEYGKQRHQTRKEKAEAAEEEGLGG
jgi:hypothetical protein